MRRERFDFTNDHGQTLSGLLELPPGKPRALALFAHCFTCSKDFIAVPRIAQGLAAKGIGVLRFDFTGLGNSEGDFANTNFTSNVADLVSAYRALESKFDAPGLLIGHSLGGAAVLAAAAELPAVRAVATLAAPSDPAHVTHLFGEDIETLKKEAQAEVTLGGRKFHVHSQFLKDVVEQNLLALVGELKRPLLICHSPKDELVEIHHAKKLFDAAHHPKSFVSLDTADHLLKKKQDAGFVADVLAGWATRYVLVEEDSPVEPGTVVVTEADKKFTRLIQMGKHRVLSDEPPALGGADEGGTPYDLLLAALGSCTSMTMRMYANHKKLPVDDIRVTLKHSKVHVKDSEEAQDKGTKVDRIEKHLEVTGDLTEEQRARILEVAERCPVNLTLKGEVQIVS